MQPFPALPKIAVRIKKILIGNILLNHSLLFVDSSRKTLQNGKNSFLVPYFGTEILLRKMGLAEQVMAGFSPILAKIDFSACFCGYLYGFLRICRLSWELVARLFVCYFQRAAKKLDKKSGKNGRLFTQAK